jgi:ribose-phosphate pyrophosphokinase
MIKLNGQLIGHGTFPNKEVTFTGLGKLIRPLEENTVTVRYDHHEKTFEAFVLLATVLNQTLAGEKLILEMPYMPYLRADRQVGDDPQMLTSILDVVSHLCGHWKAIKVFDPHVDIDRKRYGLANLQVASPESLIYGLLRNIETDFRSNEYYLVFPDAGAWKRYERLFHNHHALGWAFTPINTLKGEKTRDEHGGKITSIALEPLYCDRLNAAPKENRRAIIIDDIVSYGGTATAVARQLKEEFAFERVIAWFSHTETAYYNGRNISQDWIDKVYTTDSILENHEEFTREEAWWDKVSIIPICTEGRNHK